MSDPSQKSHSGASSVAAGLIGGWFNFRAPLAPAGFLHGLLGAFLYIAAGSAAIALGQHLLGALPCEPGSVFEDARAACRDDTWAALLSWLLLALVFLGKILPLFVRLFRPDGAR